MDTPPGRSQGQCLLTPLKPKAGLNGAPYSGALASGPAGVRASAPLQHMWARRPHDSRRDVGAPVSCPTVSSIAEVCGKETKGGENLRNQNRRAARTDIEPTQAKTRNCRSTQTARPHTEKGCGAAWYLTTSFVAQRKRPANENVSPRN